MNQNFYLSDSGNNYCVYYRRNEEYIEIIQWAGEEYENLYDMW